MRSRACNPIFFAFLVIFAFTGATRAEEEQLTDGAPAPHFNIGIITDGPLADKANFIKIIQKEIRHIAEKEYSVSFPKSMIRQADGSVKGTNRQLDILLNNPATNVIITLGPISSNEAIKRQSPNKPIIAPLVIDAAMQKAPKSDLGSGVPNLTYVDIGIPLETELMSFRKLVDFKTLGILIDERDLKASPEITQTAKSLGYEHSMTIHLIPVGLSGAGAVKNIPEGTDAVLVYPLWQISPEEFSNLSNGLIDRKIASFSMWGYEYVKQGLLATNTPADLRENLARTVSIIVQEILLGEDIANISVGFSKSNRLSINMATARALDVYPSVGEILGAELINEERKDISRSINLVTVVQTALATNLDLSIEEQKVAAGSYAVGEAKSFLLPQLGIATRGRVIDSDLAKLSQGTTPERAWTAGASASQIIYSENEWAGYTIEKYQQSGREYDRDSVRLDIVYDASIAYLNVLRQKTIELLQKENLQLTQANLERANIRLNTGVAGPDEVYRWQTKFANDRQIVLREESSTLDAMQNLNRILNRPLLEEFIAEEMDLSDPLLITGNQLFYKLFKNPRYFRGFQDFTIQEGLNSSPELKTIDVDIASQERLVLKSKRDYWVPTVSIQGDVEQYLSTSGDGQRDESLNGLDDTDWSVGVYASLPLFEGGRKSATMSKAKIELNRLKIQRKAFEERLSQTILIASNNTRASYPSINLSRDAAYAAQSNLKLVTDSYVQGIKSIIDLLDAQTQALNSDLDAANAVYNFLIDLMGVQRSIGNFIIFRPEAVQQEWLQRAKAFVR
jgi:outer membrane protein